MLEKTAKCKIWKGAINNKGYGVLRRLGKNYLAHRYEWSKINGPIPKGLELDHLCRNTLCYEPTHMEAVTHKENMRRSPIMGAPKRLRCAKGHSFDKFVTTTGKKYCSICHLNASRKYEKSGKRK